MQIFFLDSSHPLVYPKAMVLASSLINRCDSSKSSFTGIVLTVGNLMRLEELLLHLEAYIGFREQRFSIARCRNA